MIKSKKRRIGKADLKKIREEFNKSGGGGENKYFKVPEPGRGEKESRTLIRILPPWNDTSADGFFYYTGGLHYGFSIGGRNRAIPCPEIGDKGYPCPICKFNNALKKSDDDSFSAISDKIYAKRMYWMNVFDRSDPDATPKIMAGNKKMIDWVLDQEETWGDMTDLEKGRDITIVRTGKGMKTRYKYLVAKKSSVVEVNAEDLYQLDTEVLEWMSYEDMVKYLLANYGDECSELGLKFKSAKAKPVKKKKVVKEEEDDEEEEDDNEGEEQEDEEDEEDTEEEEDSDDDEEEEDNEEDEDE